MPKRLGPDGGRYTRPRRGFRAKSHYRERHDVKHVRMETIGALRKRQGYIPGPSNRVDSEGRAYSEVLSADGSLQMSDVYKMAPGDMEEMA